MSAVVICVVVAVLGAAIHLAPTGEAKPLGTAAFLAGTLAALMHLH